MTAPDERPIDSADRCPVSSDGEHLWAEVGAVSVMLDQVCLGCANTRTGSLVDEALEPPVSLRIRWRQYSPAHVEARVYCSEFGPDTSHAYAGTLRFRTGEWVAVQQLLALSITAARGEELPGMPVFQLIEDDGT